MTVASIDIGTNTILLLIADINLGTGKIKTLENFYRIPRIGKGLLPGNPISDENIKRMFDVLEEYSQIINKYNCEKVLITGTNALRIASNTNSIIAKVKEKFGYELNVIPGKDEAKLSYLGATNDYQEHKNLLVIDIGGGSTEIIFGTDSNIHFSKSYPVGVVTLTEKFFKTDPPSKKDLGYFIDHLNEFLNEISNKAGKIDTGIAIAGTPTTLACIKLKLKDYNEDLVEGSTLSKNELKNFVEELSKLNSEEIIQKYSSIVKGREDVLLAGTIILSEIVSCLNLPEVKVSTKGIRYGAIVNWINSLNAKANSSL
jgi:exopolyphosphatase / guanosine-5'-triphosphate,3'-diphosphate pyrophosphatase